MKSQQLAGKGRETKMNVLRALPVVAALLISGCKLVIQVPEGGSVVSMSGAHTCQAGQECEIGVYDVFFDETFIAQAAPGYEFLVWRRGPSRFCGGQAKPCYLSTTGFPGHDNLLAFLETDTRFYLEPVFRQTVEGEYKLEYRASDKPRVIDKNGRVIGSFAGVDEYGAAWDIEVNFQGLADTYTLTILLTSGIPLESDFYPANIAYFGDTCEDSIAPVALVSREGNFDKTRVYMRSPQKLFIPDPNGSFTTRLYSKYWDSYTFGCYDNWRAEQNRRLFPLSFTNLELQFPLTVKGTDIVIRQDLQLIVN